MTLTCPHCRYDLTPQSAPSMQCPECGRQVSRYEASPRTHEPKRPSVAELGLTCGPAMISGVWLALSMMFGASTEGVLVLFVAIAPLFQLLALTTIVLFHAITARDINHTRTLTLVGLTVLINFTVYVFGGVLVFALFGSV